MWRELNRALKKSFPQTHRYLKRMAGPEWLNEFCVPRRIAGRLVWTSPSLATTPDPETHIIRWLSELLFRGGTFFDVGAHYGWIAIAAAHCVGPFGRVAAFEASPGLLNVLSHHKRVNRLTQLEIVGKAVSNINAAKTPFFLVNGGLSFRNSLTIGPDGTPFLESQEKEEQEVESITLDRFVASFGSVPDTIKIDVEGAELLVLQGAERLIARYRPNLILGVHPYWLPQSQFVEQIFDFLDRYEYEVENEHVVPFEGGYVADYLCVQRRTSL